MAWLIHYDGTFSEHTGTVSEKIVDFISRLQTIKGEQSFNGSNGLDFLGILEGRKYSRLEIDRIASEYTDYFTVEVKETKRDMEKKALLISLILKVYDRDEIENINFNVILGGRGR